MFCGCKDMKKITTIAKKIDLFFNSAEFNLQMQQNSD